jgi:hypothetical protein
MTSGHQMGGKIETSYGLLIAVTSIQTKGIPMVMVAASRMQCVAIFETIL